MVLEVTITDNDLRENIDFNSTMPIIFAILQEYQTTNMMQKEYSKDGLTVVWKPDLCIHSKLCWKELGTVFRPMKRPWIDMDGADNDTIIAHVNKCPSGALSIKQSEQKQNKQTMEDKKQVNIKVIPGGPLIVDSTVCITHKDGTEEIRENRASMCRCGLSENKPFCDGTHRGKDFDV